MLTLSLQSIGLDEKLILLYPLRRKHIRYYRSSVCNCSGLIKHNYIRLERLHVNIAPRAGELTMDGVVESCEYYGLYIKYTLSLCGQTVKSIEKNDGTKYFETGEEVSVFIKPDDLMVY